MGVTPSPVPAAEGCDWEVRPPAAYDQSVISPELLQVLACPKCKKPVKLDEEDPALVCDQCRLRYAIVDGIPVMLIDEAKSY